MDVLNVVCVHECAWKYMCQERLGMPKNTQNVSMAEIAHKSMCPVLEIQETPGNLHFELLNRKFRRRWRLNVWPSRGMEKHLFYKRMKVPDWWQWWCTWTILPLTRLGWHLLAKHTESWIFSLWGKKTIDYCALRHSGQNSLSPGGGMGSRCCAHWTKQETDRTFRPLSQEYLFRMFASLQRMKLMHDQLY